MLLIKEVTNMESVFTCEPERENQRERILRRSLLRIITCQMNYSLTTILEENKARIVMLEMNDSFTYPWEISFMFVVPKKYEDDKIKKLFSEVKPERIGYHIPDELGNWYAMIQIYSFEMQPKLVLRGNETITERVKEIFKSANEEIEVCC